MMGAAEIILVICYTSAGCWIILKHPFFNQFKLPAMLVAGVFLLKVLTGIAYGLLHMQWYSGGDTFSYFNESKILLSALPDHPGHFFRLTFWYTVKPPPADLATYESQMIYWNVMNSYFMTRLNALMNLMSFSHYYVNVVIFNFITLTGILYLFRWLYEFVISNKYILLFLLFIFPSVAFWSSGIHKDGLALASIGIILFSFQKLLLAIRWKTVFFFLFGCWLLLMVRNYLLLLLLPCVVAYGLSAKFPKRSVLFSIAAACSCYAAILFLYLLFPTMNLAVKMMQQQQEFLTIPAAVTLPVYTLDGTPHSLLFAIPYALSNCLLLPSIFEMKVLYQIPFAADNLLLFLLFVSSILIRKKRDKPVTAFTFCLMFAFAVFLFTGSVVPNLGALLRYKLPGILFLSASLAGMIDFEKIRRWLQMN